MAGSNTITDYMFKKYTNALYIYGMWGSTNTFYDGQGSNNEMNKRAFAE